MAYAISPGQYVAAVPTQPNSLSYAPLGLASPYTAAAFTNSASGYANSAQLPAAAQLQQGQIIPYTTASNSILLSPSQLQQLNFAVPQSLGAAAATVQPYAYTTAAPVAPSVPKVSSSVVTPTAAAFYSAAPASQTYQQSPSFRKNKFNQLNQCSKMHQLASK